MLTPAEIESASMLFDGMMKRLEESVMQDIVRRIRINGEITRSADWQLHRLYELGQSRTELSRLIKKGLQIDDESLTDMFRDIIGRGYARDDRLYKMTGKTRIPFAKNEGLQQYISAVAQQTGSTMKNLSQSMGFSVNVGGRVQFQPIAAYYQDTLDNAVNGIATGAFDYNTVLKRTVKEMTDSGLRTVDYASGHVDRVDVAARRAVMTGLTQITAKVNDDNAKALETDTFEISWHSGARPFHQVWQGRWYTEKELTTVCGLGSVTGLCGANCYHSYYPVIPGVSVPNYTEEELDEMNRRENEPVEYNGREYTKYEATQRQRYLERKMRAQRQEIKLLQDGGADENDLIAARCRYRQTSQTYTDFSKAMELPQQRQRVTIDGLGNIGQGKWKMGLTNEEKQAILKEKISRGELTIRLNPDKQNPHILGSKEYAPKDNKSYFTVSLDELQKIVNERSGAGTVIIKRSGQIKEIIDIPDGIAFLVDENGNNYGITNRATIHYSKKRTHIVPAERIDNK